MYDSEMQGVTLNAQNYYRFGKMTDLVIQDVRLNDSFPALFIIESAMKVTFKNCFFPSGIILCGFYEELTFINSNIKVINSDIAARKIFVINDEDNSAKKISFIDCQMKFLWEFKAENCQISIRTINQVDVMEELSLSNCELSINCFELGCEVLTIKGDVKIHLDSQELCNAYFPLSKTEPRVRPGLRYTSLNLNDNAKATFSTSWNEMFLLNGELRDPKYTSLPDDLTGLEDFYLRKGPGDESGEAFCY